MAFRGQFDYSLDAKNRLNIPPKFRPAFAGGLVLAKWLEPCIAIFTPEGFDAMTDSYFAGQHRFSPERRKIVRFFTHNSFDAELDAAGRVTLSPKLTEHAGIERAVVVAGTDDHIEVWRPERWRTEQDSLGDEVLGLAESFGHPS